MAIEPDVCEAGTASVSMPRTIERPGVSVREILRRGSRRAGSARRSILERRIVVYGGGSRVTSITSRRR